MTAGVATVLVGVGFDVVAAFVGGGAVFAAAVATEFSVAFGSGFNSAVIALPAWSLMPVGCAVGAAVVAAVAVTGSGVTVVAVVAVEVDVAGDGGVTTA